HPPRFAWGDCIPHGGACVPSPSPSRRRELEGNPNMSRKLFVAAAAGLAIAAAGGSFASAQGQAANPMMMGGKEKTVTVGGAPMYPSKTIIQNAVNSKD